MFKRTLGVALICLNVISLNSFAASSADIDALVEESQTEARTVVHQKVLENQKLIAEINDLDKQIQELTADIVTNRKDIKRDLYIAGGSAIATILAMKYFGRSTGNEVADQFRLIFGFVAGWAGIGTTTIAAGASGVNYLLVQIDESKLPALQSRLQQLKAQLQTQNEILVK